MHALGVCKKRSSRNLRRLKSNDALSQLLLYGDHNLSNYLNRSILESTLVSSMKLVGLIEIFAALVLSNHHVP